MDKYLTEDAPVMCPKCGSEMEALRDPYSKDVTRRCTKCSYQEGVPSTQTQGLNPREGGQ